MAKQSVRAVDSVQNAENAVAVIEPEAKKNEIQFFLPDICFVRVAERVLKSISGCD